MDSIYLFISILGRGARNSNKKEILYFLIIWSGILCFNYPIFSKYKINFDISYFTGYIGYLVLGYYLSIICDDKKSKTKAFLFIGTSFASIAASKFDTSFYEYLTLNVVLLSCEAFLFLKNKPTTNGKFKKLRATIITYSYENYFVLILVLILLNKIGITEY